MSLKDLWFGNGSRTVLYSWKWLLQAGFLTIGLSGTPSLEAVGVAAILVAIVAFKVGLFYVLLTRFKLRARSSLFALLGLVS